MKPADILLAVVIMLIWGMGVVVAKAGMAHFPPILLMALRFALAAACLVWFFRPPWPLLPAIFWAALVGVTIQNALTHTGLWGIDASTAALLLNLEAPFGVLLAWLWLGDRMNLRQFCGMLLAFIGAGIIAGEPRLSGSFAHVLMVLGGALTFAMGQVMVKRLGLGNDEADDNDAGTKPANNQNKKPIGGFVLLTWLAVLGTPQLFIASALFESGQLTAIATASAAAWSAVLYLGVVMTALGYAMWYRLLGIYPVSRMMPFLLLVPVSTVAGGIIFLGERLTANMLVGGLIAIAGVVIINLDGFYQKDAHTEKIAARQAAD